MFIARARDLAGVGGTVVLNSAVSPTPWFYGVGFVAIKREYPVGAARQARCFNALIKREATAGRRT